jgi:2-methylcitrate dehydratase PrpD
MQLNQRIAEWASKLRDEDLPDDVVESTKWRVLDIIGCMLGGAGHTDTTSARRVAARTFPGTQARSVPFPDDCSIAGAAFVNGTSALVLEFDDSHLESAIHSSSPVISAALPVAFANALSGRQLIGAVAVGNELACRLGVVAPGKFHQHAFHPTGMFGTFGAIYAVSRCLRFDLAKTANAVGIGGSLSSALMASWEDGSSAKSLHAGLSALSAINATSCAENGLTGPSGVFDGRFGFYRAHVQDKGYEFAFDRVTTGLGRHWEILDIAPKAYPCGHYIQPLVDAALALKRRHGIEPEQISTVQCSIPDYVVPLVAEPVAEKRRPKTSFHGRFSLHHSMAEALISGTLDKSSFADRNLTDPRFNTLADKVEVVIDHLATDRRRLGGTVEIDLRDGRKMSFTVPHMRGMPQNPMTEADLLRKFRMNASGLMPDATVDRILSMITTLDRQKNVRTLVAAI